MLYHSNCGGKLGLSYFSSLFFRTGFAKARPINSALPYGKKQSVKLILFLKLCTKFEMVHEYFLGNLTSSKIIISAITGIEVLTAAKKHHAIHKIPCLPVFPRKYVMTLKRFFYLSPIIYMYSANSALIKGVLSSTIFYSL